MPTNDNLAGKIITGLACRVRSSLKSYSDRTAVR